MAHTQRPGALPGAKAATTSAITRITATEESEVKPSMMGVITSERSVTTKKRYASVSSFMISPSATSLSSQTKTSAASSTTMVRTFSLA